MKTVELTKEQMETILTGLEALQDNIIESRRFNIESGSEDPEDKKLMKIIGKLTVLLTWY